MSEERIKLKVEFLVSTKAELITEKVNTWIDAHPEYDVLDIIPFMSYTGVTSKNEIKGSMQVGCMIKYYEFIPFSEDVQKLPLV